jgi:hypothetical protein
MLPPRAKWLKQLEAENSKLKRLLADAMQDNSRWKTRHLPKRRHAEGGNAKKSVRPDLLVQARIPTIAVLPLPPLGKMMGGKETALAGPGCGSGKHLT